MKPGDIIRIGGDSILKGQKAVVIADYDKVVYCCTNGGLVGADWPLRHELPKDIVKVIA